MKKTKTEADLHRDVRKAKAALAAIGLMLAATLIMGLTGKCSSVGGNEPTGTSTRDIMDSMLDSLMSVQYPGREIEIIHKSGIEEIEERTPEGERLSAARARLGYAREYSPDRIPDAEREYSEALEALKSAPAPEVHYERNILYRVDRTRYACTQKADQELKSFSLTTPMKVDGDLTSRMEGMLSSQPEMKGEAAIKENQRTNQ